MLFYVLEISRDSVDRRRNLYFEALITAFIPLPSFFLLEPKVTIFREYAGVLNYLLMLVTLVNKVRLKT